MKTNNGFQGNKKNGFWSELLTFEYDLSFTSVVRLGSQVITVGMAIACLQALDGRTCGRVKFNGWNPITWVTTPACTLRGMVERVPDDFAGTGLENVRDLPDAQIPPPSSLSGQSTAPSGTSATPQSTAPYSPVTQPTIAPQTYPGVNPQVLEAPRQ